MLYGAHLYGLARAVVGGKVPMLGFISLHIHHCQWLILQSEFNFANDGAVSV